MWGCGCSTSSNPAAPGDGYPGAAGGEGGDRDGGRPATLASVEWQGQGRSHQHRSYPCGDASFSGRARPAEVDSAIEKAVDGLACAGWLSHWPKRLVGQLCRAAPGWIAGRHRDHRRHSQLPGEPPDEQITADALVVARG